MKKTVLFLMNGFGIEQLGSYNVYKPELMPNLDKYTKEYLFSSIESPAYNMSEGYRLFSTGSSRPLTYSLINNFLENLNSIPPRLKQYIENIKEESKIQLFFFMDNAESLEHLKAIAGAIREKKTNSIFLHIIMTSPDINNYKEIEKIVTKLSYDFKECKVASIIGSEVLKQSNLSTYMNLLKNEVGEKWREISKKLNSLTALKIAPRDAKEIYMNEGFKLDSSDTYFFFNYEFIDLTNFIKELTRVTNNNIYFSMFPIKGINYPIMGYPTSGISMDKSLSKIEAKALFLTSSYNMPLVNYYCNGLQNVVSENISFTKIEESFPKIRDIIEKSDYDLIIIDYQIDNVGNINDLNKKLASLDNLLAYVHDYCVEKEYSLFISSLYGMKKEIKTDNYTNSLVDFSSKVPFIVIDPIFKKANFTIGFGNVYNLAHTVYTNMNNKYVGDVLIKKKGYISKLLKK